MTRRASSSHPTTAQRQAFQVEAEKRACAILAKLEDLEGEIVQLLEDACKLYGRDRKWGELEPIRVAQAGDHRTFYLLDQVETLRYEVLGQWPQEGAASAVAALRQALAADAGLTKRVTVKALHSYAGRNKPIWESVSVELPPELR